VAQSSTLNSEGVREFQPRVEKPWVREIFASERNSVGVREFAKVHELFQSFKV